MARPTTDQRIESALTRAAFWEFLAHAFAYPNDERIAALHESAAEVLAGDANVPALRMAAVAKEASRDYLETVYISLTTFSSSPDAPAFESAYFGGDAQQQTQRMADIAGFYRAFGVDSTDGGFRPDELPVELEFMAYLCRKEAYAEEHLGAPRAGQTRKAQRLFLEEHLGRWGAAFGRRVASQAPAGHFYQLAGETLSYWVLQECSSAGVTPVEVSGDTSRHWPQPISHGPEFAGDASFVPMEELAVR
ncbi:molecular chaperone TorD family protein [Candidatus Amarobacter glycogenicus]|uniref:TorD/DmsD family molecular chaperone n=1 Tax=Candidatus Amarobacter glycogenicus TaxID=3140699 RepID=UPI0031353498|nr:molecular chaperone TorD family protein [Dehalococcoidia bacterium]